MVHYLSFYQKDEPDILFVYHSQYIICIILYLLVLYFLQEKIKGQPPGIK